MLRMVNLKTAEQMRDLGEIKTYNIKTKTGVLSVISSVCYTCSVSFYYHEVFFFLHQCKTKQE